VLALPSDGLHTNGYSLARKVFGLDGSVEETRQRLDAYEPALDCTLGEALTRPHRSYLHEITRLLDLPERPVQGMAHITGGGLIDNIPRVLPEGCAVEICADSWDVPPLFRLIAERGGVSKGEMARVFNMGVGMVLLVAPEHIPLVRSVAPELFEIGEVVTADGDERVRILPGKTGAQ
jgi:phosphoribosylformylglycinamidine cyclo-ligase